MSNEPAFFDVDYQSFIELDEPYVMAGHDVRYGVFGSGLIWFNLADLLDMLELNYDYESEFLQGYPDDWTVSGEGVQVDFTPISLAGALFLVSEHRPLDDMASWWRYRVENSTAPVFAECNLRCFDLMVDVMSIWDAFRSESDGHNIQMLEDQMNNLVLAIREL